MNPTLNVLVIKILLMIFNINKTVRTPQPIAKPFLFGKLGTSTSPLETTQWLCAQKEDAQTKESIEDEQSLELSKHFLGK